ncbi:MAG: YwqG family protein [Ruminococcus flavefaciens]|nr:YwqG family protein [Ruminococcus flavefaciens]MCM1229846.1 YwqG family protein [Ruminococcus flavefaciens]
MNNLAEKLRRNGFGFKYDSKNGIIEIPDREITVYRNQKYYCVRMRIDSQNFAHNIMKCNDAYDFIIDVLSGKIAFTRIDETCMRMDNWENNRREIKLEKIFRLIGRILSVTVGTGLVLFWTIFLIMGLIYFIDYTSLNWLEDSTPVPTAVAGIVIGVSLIHHGLTKNPITFGGAVLYGVGVVLVSFGMSLVFVMFGRYNIVPRVDFYGAVGVDIIFMAFGIFMLVSGLRSKSVELKVDSCSRLLVRIPELPPEKDLQRLIEAVKEKTSREGFLIHLNPEKNPTILESKIGGLPYWDMSLPYPVDEEGNEMQLLAQFNLSEVPENDKLPREGMLQFFILLADETKVVYHKTINESFTEDDIAMLGISCNKIFPGECGMSFERELFPLHYYDESTFEVLHETAKELDIPLDSTIQLYEICDDSEYNDFYESCLLGNAYYINDDIRPENSRYNTLLFQMDSIDNEKIHIMWGDCGIAQFFINDEDLTDLNFDDVFFDYDCY